MKPKSICFVSLGAWDSVLCLRARNFGKHLSEMGWKVDYLIPDLSSNQESKSDHVFVLPASFTGFVFQARSLLKQLKPAYVHFLNPEAKAAAISLLNRKTTVIGDWEDWHAIARDKGLKKYVTRFCDWYMRHRSDIVIVTSRWLQQEFKDLCTHEPHYVPYAVLPRDFPDMPNPFREATAVFMGSLNRQWDHDILLDAIFQLKKERYTPPIKIIGGGTGWNEAKAFCEQHELENVELTGYLDWDEMLNNLQWAHVLLFPIRDKVANRARCPFKVFQYAQAKRPIVTNRVGEVPAVLNDNAIYIEPTPTAFAEQIRNFMDQPRLPDVEYGIENLSWSLRTEELLNAINSA